MDNLEIELPDKLEKGLYFICKLLGYKIKNTSITSEKATVILGESDDPENFANALREAAHMLIFDKSRGVKLREISKIAENYELTVDELAEVIDWYFSIVDIEVSRELEYEMAVLLPSEKTEPESIRLELTPIEQRMLLLTSALLLLNKGEIALEQVIEEAKFHEISKPKRYIKKLIDNYYLTEENNKLTYNWKLKIILKRGNLQNTIIQKLRTEKLKLITLAELAEGIDTVGMEDD